MGSCCGSYEKLPEDVDATSNITENNIIETLECNYENINVLRNAALIGDTNAKIPPISRIIRLFISSTLRDMVEERNIIMKKLYPMLERYCSEKGYILQIIDLRWGIFETAIDHQLTSDICLLEVELAKEISNGPCFIAIVSHRYGTTFLPCTIIESEFKNLRKVCDKVEKRLLDEWFLLDQNNKPTIRVLKNIETEQLKKQWNENDSRALFKIFNKLAEKSFTDQSLINRSTKSITELEIIKGIFENQDLSDRCLVYLRNFTCFRNIEVVKAQVQPSNQLAITYLDVEKDAVNYTNYQKVEELKRNLKEYLPSRNLIEFNLKIDLNGSESMNKEEIDKYLVEFSASFSENLKNIIETSLNRNQLLFQLLNDYSDLFHHLRFCQMKLKTFVGRSLHLVKIRYMLQANKKLTVIHGLSGSGKTSLTAKVATQLRRWFPNDMITIVLRFIGTSQDSYNIQSLLSSIIRQLSIKYEITINYEKMWPINILFTYFKTFLVEVSNSCGNDVIVILLDSIDQLSPEYDGRKLEWFPNELPENIKFVISTLTDPEFQAFPALKMIVKDNDAFIELNELNNDEIQEIIENKLQKFHRTLTDKQMEAVQNTFKHCSIPLYMKLVLDKAVTWKSYDNIDGFVFQNDITLAIHSLFEYTEQLYGKEFVVSVLRYITLSRHGFFENYLQDILSNDEHVRKYLEEQFQYSELPARIPQVFLIRLINSLREYLTAPMYRWYHRMFQFVAFERYCSNSFTIFNEKCHLNIVKTFNHEKYNKNNVFWINELPYHATFSNDINYLKEDYLLDLKFMQNKIQATDIDNLINDYQLAINSVCKDDETLSLINQTLLIAAYKIRTSPLELPGQLYGRLYDLNGNKELQHFLKKCFVPPQTCIIPNKAFMAKPSKLLSKTVSIHRNEIKSVIVSNNNNYIITCDNQNCMKIFSSSDLSLKKTIHKRFNSTSYLTISSDDTILYASSRITDEKLRNEAIIEAFDLSNGSSLFEIQSDLINSFGNAANHKHLLYSKHMNELWLVTKDIWFKIEWRTGQIDVKRHLPEAFSSKPDDFLAAATVKNRLICVLDIKPMVVSLDAISSDVIVRDLKDQTVMGRCILILPNGTVALSLRRIFKSSFDETEEMEWHIMLCDPVTLDTIRMIPVSKALNMWRCSLDGKIIYSRAFNYIYVIDIEEKQTKYILEHSSQLNSCCALNDNTILSSTWDNKLNIWELDKISDSDFKNVDLFNTFNSRMIRFLHNDFNNKSRYALFYNLFDVSSRELFLLYDLCEEKVVRKYVFENYTRNDLRPMTFLGDSHILVYFQSENFYCLIELDKFIIHMIIPCDEIKIFQRINETQVILSMKDSDDQSNSLVLFDSVTFQFELLLPNINKIEFYNFNKKSIIYKVTGDENIFIFHIETRSLWNFSTKIGEKMNNFLASENGRYLALTSTENDLTSILIYSLNCDSKTANLYCEIQDIANIYCIQFIEDSYLLYQKKIDNNRVTCVCDFVSTLDHIWFKDDDKIGNFDCFSSERSDYIWYQRYQVNRWNQVKTDLTVFHKSDISKPLATLDVDCRLKINQMALIDDGNAVIVKELDKLSFVTFSVRSETSPPNTINVQFNSSKFEPNDQEIVWRK